MCLAKPPLLSVVENKTELIAPPPIFHTKLNDIVIPLKLITKEWNTNICLGFEIFYNPDSLHMISLIDVNWDGFLEGC